MGKKLVALLRCRIQADGVVNAVLDSERHFLVATVDRTGTGIDQMLDGVMPAGLEDVVEAYDVALDVCIRILNAVVPPPACAARFTTMSKRYCTKRLLMRAYD